MFRYHRVASKILALADRPEDVLLESLEMLQVPHSTWQQYLSLHLAALPGWAGFIKWREEQEAYAWQVAYRIDLVKYLAVRLFYERELVATACRKSLGCEGTTRRAEYGTRYPYSLWFRRASVSGDLLKQWCRRPLVCDDGACVPMRPSGSSNVGVGGRSSVSVHAWVPRRLASW